jgi:hypothetical protein
MQSWGLDFFEIVNGFEKEPEESQAEQDIDYSYHFIIY